MPRTRSISDKKKEAARFRSLRTKLGLTQREIAAEFYSAPGAVGQWETGDRTIPGPILRLMEIYEAGQVKPGKVKGTKP